MSEELNELEMDSGADLLTLVDEDGVEHEFEIADTAEIDGQAYMALIPCFENPAELLDDPGELIILKVMEEDGEEFLEAIEDEEEFDRIGDYFVDHLSEVYDFEDE